MIGNDIVDLALAKTESNWKRKGFLEKIFTENERKIILSSKNQELMVWILWSCKEAAYKIYNRAAQFRGFIPLQLECELEYAENKISGKVRCFGNEYYTETDITSQFIYTVAATNKNKLQSIKEFDKDLKIIKNNGIPYLESNKNPISITHHGKFDRRIFLEIN
ncbi:4'-phosphopantetheinyl transferase family protein [Flavobacterium soli]|uniref:4'-phosphopantetheinyl transferase family protein n=1 Tax=Flavobacterium soli TaxID=344881 RepID=UPI0004258579|nr:4'-phosphopantetheinyl transferase superfamily protein [Flavobacterium soli]